MRPVLEYLDRDLIDRLYALGHNRAYGVDQEIFARGDRADFLPIIISGSVKMIRNPEPGKEIIIGTFHAGEMFAVPPVVDGEPYPSTALAREKTVLLQIGREDFLALLHESPELAYQVILWMCEMLREKTWMIRTLATPSPEQRIGRILVKMFEDGPTAQPFRIPIRRQDIAEMAGLTTETVIRVVLRLSQLGLVRIEHGKIFIDEIKLLRKFIK